MFQRDGVTWTAAGIFICGIALGAAVHQFFFFLLAGAYLLRPGLVAFGLGRRLADERQMQVQFHSGNIALILVIVALIAVAIRESLAGRPADTFYLLISIALIGKALVGLVMLGDYRAAAVRIALFIALLYLLFVGLSHGFTAGFLIEGAPGFAVLTAGLLGIRKPLIGAGIFAVLGLASLYVFGVLGGITAVRVYVSLALSVPLCVVAFCFFRGRGPKGEGMPVDLPMDDAAGGCSDGRLPAEGGAGAGPAS